jgi:thiamine biosynthesis lipoprotein
VEQIMGLPVSVLARGGAAHSQQAAAAVRGLFDELAGVDAVFSPYREGSQVSKLARGEVELADCNAEVREVVAGCQEARELTGGLFDATPPDGRWDPSGLVKGWAVERATRRLLDAQDVDWCVNAGGDVAVVCPSNVPFTVGIQDPFDPGRVVAALPCSGGGVATSGTAARGAHLYDPRTGADVAPLASVTVAGPSLTTADVLATAAFVAGESALSLIGTFRGYEALQIDLEGDLSATTGWTGSTGSQRGRSVL